MKDEPVDGDSMYFSDSNSMSGKQDQPLVDGINSATTNNQQFMDELLGNSSDAGPSVSYCSAAFDVTLATYIV